MYKNLEDLYIVLKKNYSLLLTSKQGPKKRRTDQKNKQKSKEKKNNKAK